MTSEPRSPPSLPRHGAARILCVDDEPNTLSALKRQLHGEFNVETASSGTIGLGMLNSRHPYEAVIADYYMPEMNGVRLLEQVAECQPNAVRLLLTGHAELDTAIAAVNEGQIFIPMHFEATNQLTHPSFDPYSRQPSYKHCAVRIESLD